MKKLLSLVGLAMGLGYASQGMAAGFALIEHSASGMGNAFAGGAAIADDASTIQFNPAGLTRLNGRELVAAIHSIDPTATVSDRGSTAATGGALTGPNDDGGVPALVPNFYYAAAPSENYRYGLGINVPFGLGTEYDDDWVGRYHAIKSDMRTLNINPSAAFKLGDSLSLGVGVSLQYVEVELTSAVDFGGVCSAQELGGVLPPGTCAAAGLSPQQNDGFADISGDNWSYGWNLGLLYQLSESSRIGFSYRSSVKQEVDGNADFTVPGNAAFLTSTGLFIDSGAQATVTLPAMASLSLYHDYSDQLAVMADISWTDWSVFDELRVTYDNTLQPDSVTTENWRDTIRISAGANYRANDAILLRAGVAYDQGAVSDDQHRTPRVPDADRLWLAVGLGWTLTDTTQIDIGYAHLFVNDANLANTYESSVPTINHTLNGSVEASVDIFSVQLRMAL